jgi:ATP-binding cassette subfamily B protein
MSEPHDPPGFGAELRSTLRRARQVWPLVPRQHKAALTAAAVIMAVTSAASTIIPVLLGGMVDAVRAGAEQGLPHGTLYTTAGRFLVLMTLAYLLRETLHVLRRFLVENTCTRLNRDMCVGLVAHLMKLDLGTLSREKVGALHGRIFRSVDGFVRFLRLSFLDFIPALLTGAFALTAVVLKQPVIGLVMLGVVPLAVFLTVRQLITQKGVRLQLMRSCEEIDGAVVEQFGGMEYVRAADTHALEVQRLARAAEHKRAKEIRHHFEMSLFGCGKALNEAFFHVLVLGVAIAFAIAGQISLGDVFTLSLLFLSVMTPLAEIHRIVDEGHESSLRVSELMEMLNRPEDRSFATVSARPPALALREPAILVDSLHVEYVDYDRERRCALDGVSLTIRHGETIGVAGRSGCGKTTLMRVLLRLVHPCDGSVVLGDQPLEKVSRADLAQLIGYVGQTPFLFAGTVAENIAYGCGPASAEDIRRAAAMAHIHDEIMQMPGGYGAPLSERGQNLSGGQRQRLALARVLLKNPPILILDEATSALDNICEKHIQQALSQARRDRTTILVAHRLTTLRDADRIFVFADGKLAETGSYEELLGRGGVFTELVQSAAKGEGACTNGAEPG